MEKFKFWKAVILTVIVMGMFAGVYWMADVYLFGVSQILNGVLVVAGFIFITILVFLMILAEPMPKRETPPWEREWQRGE